MAIDFVKLLHEPPRPPPRVPRTVVAITGHRPHKLYSRPPSPEDLAIGVDLEHHEVAQGHRITLIVLHQDARVWDEESYDRVPKDLEPVKQ